MQCSTQSTVSGGYEQCLFGDGHGGPHHFISDGSMSTSRFPIGNIATQERFIAAFEGLTQILSRVPVSNRPDWYVEKWEEMFHELRGEEEPDAVV